MKAIKVVSILIGTLFFVLGLLSVIGYLSSPEDYRFGSEVHGLLYKSVYHYLSINIGVVAISSLSILFALKSRYMLTVIALLLAGGLFLV